MGVEQRVEDGSGRNPAVPHLNIQRIHAMERTVGAFVFDRHHIGGTLGGEHRANAQAQFLPPALGVGLVHNTKMNVGDIAKTMEHNTSQVPLAHLVFAQNPETHVRTTVFKEIHDPVCVCLEDTAHGACGLRDRKEIRTPLSNKRTTWRNDLPSTHPTQISN